MFNQRVVDCNSLVNSGLRQIVTMFETIIGNLRVAELRFAVAWRGWLRGRAGRGGGGPARPGAFNIQIGSSSEKFLQKKPPALKQPWRKA